MKTFSELTLTPALQSNLARHGFKSLTPVQAEAIPPALQGRDLVATAPTGTGKTLAFALPVLEKVLANPTVKGIQALILSPTRELAMQIHDALANVAGGTGIRAAVVVGGLNERAQLNAIRNGASIVIATPGRLVDFLERKLVKLGTLSVLVIDEADRMLDMGFLPALTRILSEVPATRQTLFFSATMESSVVPLVRKHLKDPVRISLGTTTKPVEKVDLHFYEVEPDRKLGLLHSLLKSESGSFLVFARTKHGTEKVAKDLARGGVRAARIHGDRTQNQRTQALRGFQDGQYRVLVATDVAARGIHVDGIAHVVNYDLPGAPEDFIHRVGRTGRAGAVGTASTFGTRSERGEVRRIEKALNVQLTRRKFALEAVN